MDDLASRKLTTGPADWISQRDLCGLLGISEHTGSAQAKAGQLRKFEHGVSNAGARKYSRQLVELELRIQRPTTGNRRRGSLAKSKNRTC